MSVSLSLPLCLPASLAKTSGSQPNFTSLPGSGTPPRTRMIPCATTTTKSSAVSFVSRHRAPSASTSSIYYLPDTPLLPAIAITSQLERSNLRFTQPTIYRTRHKFSQFSSTSSSSISIEIVVYTYCIHIHVCFDLYVN